ncbi:hypothetical protein [Streptomyces sp. NPDC051776]|uniref:hypothetical protein n=1 Tax=Streptomyces sp. NPDC051776 TaxID=3155414 RepID=UPI00343117FF
MDLADGRTSLGGRGVPRLPGMTDEEAGSCFGATVFPNMFIDISGSEAMLTSIRPTVPQAAFW